MFLRYIYKFLFVIVLSWVAADISFCLLLSCLGYILGISDEESSYPEYEDEQWLHRLNWTS